MVVRCRFLSKTVLDGTRKFEVSGFPGCISTHVSECSGLGQDEAGHLRHGGRRRMAGGSRLVDLLRETALHEIHRQHMDHALQPNRPCRHISSPRHGDGGRGERVPEPPLPAMGLFRDVTSGSACVRVNRRRRSEVVGRQFPLSWRYPARVCKTVHLGAWTKGADRDGTCLFRTDRHADRMGRDCGTNPYPLLRPWQRAGERSRPGRQSR